MAAMTMTSSQEWMTMPITTTKTTPVPPPPSNPSNPPGIALESETHEDDGSAGGNDAGNDATDEEVEETAGVYGIIEETHEEEIPGVIPGVNPSEEPPMDPSEESIPSEEPFFNPSEEAGDDDGDDSEPPPLQQGPDDDSSDNESDDDEDNSNTPCNPDSWTPSVQRVHGLGPRKGRGYSHLHANIVHYAMTQYLLKKGLKKFKGNADEVVSKELMQLHLKDTFIPKDEGELTEAQKKGAPKSLMLLKEKRDGSIKGRACADGRKQRE
jgi:hypothetical protein